MKKVIVEINDKRHGPLNVGGDAWKHVYVCGRVFGLDDLEDLGAIIEEVREPWRLDCEVKFSDSTPLLTVTQLVAWPDIDELYGKRFKCKLVEVLEDES